MIKYYSDTLDKWFPSVKEAEAAEKKFEADKLVAKKKTDELNTKIEEIKKQRDTEVEDCTTKYNEISAEVAKLTEELEKIKTNVRSIREEAEAQIYELITSSEDVDEPEYRIKIKTFDSEHPEDNIDFETTDLKEAIAKCKGTDSLIDTYLNRLLGIK